MKKYTDEGTDFIRECIGTSIFELMKQKKFDEISVTEICSKANVGRTTYYRYYGAKTGKKDALVFTLQNQLQSKLTGDCSLNEIDKTFLEFIFDKKEELRMINNNGIVDVIDSLIFNIYGPDAKDDKSMRYTKYAAAGLWVGLIRAILANDFADDAEVVQENMATGIMQLIANR